MVKLTKIYTKTGDDGTTGLGTGDRISKDSIRVDSYGEVDEANAALGLAVVECTRAGNPYLSAMAGVLVAIQQDLFDVGADLCIPVEANEKPASKLRVQPEQTRRLEDTIDQYNEKLSPLNSFVLPGGTGAAAALHLARTVVRRAERRVVTLRKAEPAATSAEAVKYLNRLSDLLFVLGRAANQAQAGGKGDVLWVPGANRSK